MARRTKKDPRDFLPLKPVDLLVLMTLLDGERHGYGMVQDISERTNGRVTLVPGNFYSILRRLMKLDLLQDAPEKDRGDDDQRRKYYRITPLGKQVAAAEAERLRSLVDEAVDRNLINKTAPGS